MSRDLGRHDAAASRTARRPSLAKRNRSGIPDARAGSRRAAAPHGPHLGAPRLASRRRAAYLGHAAQLQPGLRRQRRPATGIDPNRRRTGPIMDRRAFIRRSLAAGGGVAAAGALGARVDDAAASPP